LPLSSSPSQRSHSRLLARRGGDEIAHPCAAGIVDRQRNSRILRQFVRTSTGPCGASSTARAALRKSGSGSVSFPFASMITGPHALSLSRKTPGSSCPLQIVRIAMHRPIAFAPQSNSTPHAIRRARRHRLPVQGDQLIGS